MERRKLSIAKCWVARIGLGGIPIQRNDVVDCIKLVDYLEEAGVNFIDTARGYTCSEEYLGEALKGRRDKFIIATKSMARTYDLMKRDIEISLKNLQTNYIDLYQIHNLKSADEYDVVMSDKGAYKALLEAKEKGLIGSIGITSHSSDFLNKVLDDNLFQTIQFPYNIVEDKNKELFKKAHDKGIVTICMKPLAGGAIDNGQVALKFLLNDENVDIIIPGMKDQKEAKVNISAEKGEYTQQEKDYIKKIKMELNNDFCRRCGYCLPCTKGIDIPSCFMFQGYFERYDLKDWAISRYEAMKVHASDCVNCGKCLKRCPYSLNIPKKLQEVVRDFGK